MPLVPVRPNTSDPASEAISADLFGANFVYDYERIGDLPWERFDELIDQLGSPQLRYPGGNAIETAFDYLNPDSSVDLDGDPVMGLSDFIAFTGTRGIEPIILLPTRPFLPNESHPLLVWDAAKGGWAIDPAAVPQARAVIDSLVTKALAAADQAGVTIAAFQIGNEFPGVTYSADDGTPRHMSGAQYGVLANEIAQWIDETVAAAGTQGDPQVLVQVRGDFNHGGTGWTSIQATNARVLEQFDADGLAAIDGTSSHIYFREGKTPGDGLSIHSYDTLGDRIAELAALSDPWSAAAGRDLGLHITEWSVQKTTIEDPNAQQWQNRDFEWHVSAAWKDVANFGLKQIAPMLEMTAAFNLANVQSAQLWPVMFGATALGLEENGGTLTVPGALVAVMTDLLPGTRYLDVDLDAEAAGYDLHVFEGDAGAHVFVSALTEIERVYEVDLSAFAPAGATVSVTYLRADTSASDGRFISDGYTYIVGDAVWLEADLPGLLTTVTEPLVQDTVSLTLGAYEMAVISVNNGLWNRIEGTDAAESLKGTAQDDWIRGYDGADSLRGGAGADLIEGGAGNDALSGGRGADQIEGGAGDDDILGGAGRDLIKGGAGLDTIRAGAGRDQIFAGRGDDVVHGGRGGDMMRGQQGRDALFGDDGNDLLRGGGGADMLDGGDGRDRLRGDGGNDMLTGGTGADRFIFLMDQNSGKDEIVDFTPGEDMLELRDGGGDVLAQISVLQSGDHVDLTWDTGSVRLLNITLDVLGATEDFIEL